MRCGCFCCAAGHAAKNKKSEPFSFEKRFGSSLSGAGSDNELLTWADVYDTVNHDERRAILQQFIKEIRIRLQGSEPGTACQSFLNTKNAASYKTMRQKRKSPRQTFLLVGTRARSNSDGLRWLIFPQPLGRALKNPNAAPTAPPCFSHWLRSSPLHWTDCLPCLRQGRAVRIPLGPKASV